MLRLDDNGGSNKLIPINQNEAFLPVGTFFKI